MADLRKIRAREQDPAVLEHAQRVSSKILARIDGQRIDLYGKLAQRMPAADSKLGVLRGLTEVLSTAARDLVPCSRGCSSCCHMPTHLLLQEAEVIAAETGAYLATPAQWFGASGDEHRYDGIPCSFLKGDTCSIYAHRPFACRLHIHLDRDNTLCTVIPGEDIRVPRLDTLQYDLAYMAAFGHPAQAKLADIREFFPQGLAR
jgi:Fe-S-cluster containining protein